MLVLLLIFQNMSCYCQILIWMKNVNSFRMSKVRPQGVAQHLLDFFCQFQPGVAYKSAAYKKKQRLVKRIAEKLPPMLRVCHDTSIQIKLFILPLKKNVEKQLIVAYHRGEIPLKKFNTKRKMPPENYPRQTPAPREYPPWNKATLQIQVVFQAQDDRMNYQTSKRRRIAQCWMLLVQASKDISQPGQAYKMGILEKIVNGLQFILRLI